MVGGGPCAACGVVIWALVWGSGYVSPVFAAGATLEYTVSRRAGNPKGLSPWAVTAQVSFQFQRGVGLSGLLIAARLWSQWTVDLCGLLVSVGSWSQWALGLSGLLVSVGS